MNFKNWKIVDIDNYMDGNHFFKEITDENLWQKNVENTLGGTKTKTWMEDKLSSPLYSREILFPAI